MWNCKDCPKLKELMEGQEIKSNIKIYTKFNVYKCTEYNKLKIVKQNEEYIKPFDNCNKHSYKYGDKYGARN